MSPVQEVPPIPRIGASFGNFLVIGVGATIGVIVMFSLIHWLASLSVPGISPAAQGVESVINYGKAA